MIIWAIMWLYFRLECSIDWGGEGNLVIDWLPNFSTTISQKDEQGYRLWQFSAYFLIFGVTLTYYYPALFQFNESGEIVGKNIYPSVSTMQD